MEELKLLNERLRRKSLQHLENAIDRLPYAVNSLEKEECIDIIQSQRVIDIIYKQVSVILYNNEYGHDVLSRLPIIYEMKDYIIINDCFIEDTIGKILTILNRLI